MITLNNWKSRGEEKKTGCFIWKVLDIHLTCLGFLFIEIFSRIENIIIASRYPIILPYLC